MTLGNALRYCYIFSPYVMKVTCEDETDPTKEVTIVGNGITLKRNCIASVAYFDLSVIFESYFTDTNFVFDYTADAADPFYKAAAITFSATDETTITNEAFYLRWGAMQFDQSVLSGQTFNFPFWVAQPLLVNSPAYSSKQFIDATEKTGNQTIPLVKIADFVYTVYNALAGNYQIINYQIATCPTSGTYLCWVDSWGQIWHYMFYNSITNRISIEVKSGDDVPVYPLSLTDSYLTRSKVISKERTRSINCYQNFEDTIYPVLYSLISSPIVKMYTNSKWIEVKIKDGTFTPKTGGLVDIEFTVELPTDYIQIR